jgi:cytochrome c oxidase subunit IV
MAEHIAPKKIYIIIFSALICLTALTTAVAFVDLGPWNTVVALLIAICKATLVATFFMHLRWSGYMTRLVAIAALFWLAILISLTMNDILTRNWQIRAHPWSASTAISSPTVTANRR